MVVVHAANIQDREGAKLVLGDELLIRPAGALGPETAYQLMSFGMRNGSFTGKN
jgi:hypothetical protein